MFNNFVPLEEPEPWAIVLGFLFALGVGTLLINIVINKMWNVLDEDPDIKRGDTSRPELKRYTSQPLIVGLTERSLYMMSLMMGGVLFIGIWLTLKTLVESKRWVGKEPSDPNRTEIPGRAIYNIFLIGNGLSILYAFGGYGFVYLEEQGRVDLGWGILAAIVALTITFGIITDVERKRFRREKP